MFIGLNPSTADEINDDPTVRRCLGYARDWGYGGLIMTNIFAFRATNPRVMKASPDPIGPLNDSWLTVSARRAVVVVAAWGNHGAYQGRGRKVVELLGQMGVKLMCLGVMKVGEPCHPLYLPKNREPVAYHGPYSPDRD